MKSCLNCANRNKPTVLCETCVIRGGTPTNWQDTNPYWERICKLSERQRAKGMEKYGFGLENNPAEIIERINHLQEELLDGLMYCEWLKDKLEAEVPE